MTWSLAANGSDDPFDVSTLPRRAGSGQNFFDAHSLDLINEVPAEDPIAIPQQVARCGVPGKGLPELLDTPFCCGMCGHGEVENPPAVSFANNRSGQKLLCRNTFIAVMESADLWNGDNLSKLQRLSRKRTLLIEAQVGSRFVVVAEIGRQRSLEMASV